MALNGEAKENKFKLRKAEGWEMEMTQEKDVLKVVNSYSRAVRSKKYK